MKHHLIKIHEALAEHNERKAEAHKAHSEFHKGGADACDEGDPMKAVLNRMRVITAQSRRNATAWCGFTRRPRADWRRNCRTPKIWTGRAMSFIGIVPDNVHGAIPDNPMRLKERGFRLVPRDASSFKVTSEDREAIEALDPRLRQVISIE